MSSKILFIFEGTKTEEQIFDSLHTHIFNANTKDTVVCAYGAEIYQLYEQILREADGEEDFIDVFEVLKQREEKRGVNNLSCYTRNDFDEIFLFFDYDGHAIGASDDKIEELIEYFNEETENGRLLISYPMVEALKHYNDDPFVDKCVKCKEKIDYKKLVSSECKFPYIDITRYTKDVWSCLISEHLKKMNYIVNDNYALPAEVIFQDVIFQKQLEKFILPYSNVSVLSAFPLFIHDYFGNERTIALI